MNAVVALLFVYVHVGYVYGVSIRQKVGMTLGVDVLQNWIFGVSSVLYHRSPMGRKGAVKEQTASKMARFCFVDRRNSALHRVA